MSRYIDADNLIKKMERRYEEMRLKYGEYDQFNMGFAEGMVAIDNAPTLDVVAVTRCKDCLHAKYNDYEGVYECGRLKLFVNGEFYCFYGIRRPNDDGIY